MKPRTFAALAGVTAAAVIAAGIGISTKTGTTALTPGTEPAFPALAEAVNDASRIEVQTASDKFSLSRKGEIWGLDQKDGYPAAFDKVKSAIVGVANFKLIERKTADPERYARLDLGSPEGKDAKSKKLVFRNEKGEVLADVLLGKINANLFGAGGSGTYIRRGDDKETWLARGQVTIGDGPINWVVREIVDYGQEHIRHVSIRDPDRSEFVIAKGNKSDKNFKLLDLPEGRKMKKDDEANPLGGVMWKMQFDDVKKAASQEWPENPWIAEYTAWDGFKVRIEVYRIGEDHWGRFKASLDDEAEPETREKAGKIVDEINSRVSGWSYMLTAGDSEKLTSKMEEYLADPEAKKDS